MINTAIEFLSIRPPERTWGSLSPPPPWAQVHSSAGVPPARRLRLPPERLWSRSGAGELPLAIALSRAARAAHTLLRDLIDIEISG